MPEADKIDKKNACLFVVATPIGNMDDITIRAIRTLGSVDWIAAEDTRHTGKLLNHHGIRSRLVSCHEHNETERTPFLVEKLKTGQSVAIVSDAGTPGVSDPGYRLVQAAVENDIPVVPIPGPSAAITALSASGLPSDSFIFIGFAPSKKNKRQRLLESLAQSSRTLIFYESSRRIVQFIDEIISEMGDRYGVIGRELTKMHEEFVRGTLSQIQKHLKSMNSIKGEITLLVEGQKEDQAMTIGMLQDEMRRRLDEKRLSPSQLAKEIGREYGISRQDVYSELLKLQRDQD